VARVNLNARCSWALKQLLHISKNAVNNIIFLMNEICFVFINKEHSVTFITPDWEVFDRKLIFCVFFLNISNISVPLLHKAFLLIIPSRSISAL
jgi:hypothetical protein